MKNKVVFIVGPTGVGKTDLAFQLAKDFEGELVSADSVQVYKGLDIVSGKDLPKTAKYFPLPQFNLNGYNTGFYSVGGIRIFLLDIVEPTSLFSVSDFQKHGRKVCHHILSKRKIPIVVGGTGLYIKSLIDGCDMRVEPDFPLRKKLDSLVLTQLQLQLQSLSSEKFESLNHSDKNNPRRLIRAIEVMKTNDQQITKDVSVKFESLVIGLTCDMEVLKERINARVEVRIKSGALMESEKLFENYGTLAPQIKDANGYKHLFLYLKNELTMNEAISQWKISEYHHAKNQMTWFRKYGNVIWFDIKDDDYKEKISKRINTFLE